jgi:molybdopterin converting factor small subunit
MNSTRVRVVFIPMHLRELAGVAEEELDLGDNPTVMSLLVKLREVHGPRLYEQLYDERTGDLRSGVLLVANNRVVQKISEKLENGSTLIVTIAYEGGALGERTSRPDQECSINPWNSLDNCSKLV